MKHFLMLKISKEKLEEKFKLPSSDFDLIFNEDDISNCQLVFKDKSIFSFDPSKKFGDFLVKLGCYSSVDFDFMGIKLDGDEIEISYFGVSKF